MVEWRTIDRYRYIMRASNIKRATLGWRRSHNSEERFALFSCCHNSSFKLPQNIKYNLKVGLPRCSRRYSGDITIYDVETNRRQNKSALGSPERWFYFVFTLIRITFKVSWIAWVQGAKTEKKQYGSCKNKNSFYSYCSSSNKHRWKLESGLWSNDRSELLFGDR